MVTPLKTTDLGIENQRFYSRAWLNMLKHNLVHLNFAVNKPMPPNNGKTIVFRYYDPLSPATTALTEGTVPDGSKPVVNEITATLAHYGDYIEVTDEVGVFDIDGNLLISPQSSQNVELLSQQSMETLDTVARNVLAAGTNVYYSGAPTVTSRSEVTSANKVKRSDFKAIVRYLRQQKVRPVAPMITAATGQGTKPIASSYIAFVGPETVHDIEELDGYMGVFEYPNPTVAYPDEIGALRDVGIRFIQTTNSKEFASSGSGGIDVHATIIIGQGAYGVTNLNAADAGEIIGKPFGSAGTKDPINQLATMGWSVRGFVVKRLREVAIYRYEHAVSS